MRGLPLLLTALLWAGAAQALEPWEARHLLSRTGFGAAPQEIARLLPLDRPAAVRRLIDTIAATPTFAMPAWTRAPKPDFAGRGKLDKAGRQRFSQARRREIAELRAWWLGEMIATPTPLTERLVLFWHNHFTSSFRGTKGWTPMLAAQNALFRRHAGGSFADLLAAMVRDPALLHYLDNTRSSAKRPNENFARELLELFTLGPGAYDERDVKEVARAFAGWSVDPRRDYAFTRLPRRQDDGMKQILGTRGRLDGDDVVRLLLARPETGRTIVRKFWRAFVSPTPDEDRVEALAREFRRDKYRLRPLLAALFAEPAFWQPGTLVRSPVHLLVGTIRSLGLPVGDIAALPVAVRRMGQDLFEPPNVKGWPGGEVWIDSARLGERYHMLRGLLDEWSPRFQRTARARPDERLRLRIAGEAYREKPRYALWVNGRYLERREVARAHDARRFGPVGERLEDLDWEIAGFRPPADDGPVRTVTVSFLNDGCSRPRCRKGDRNLYVDWLELDGRRYAAEQARQQDECRQPSTPGRLYCRGRLTFDLRAPPMPGDSMRFVARSAARNGSGDGDMEAPMMSPGRTWRHASRLAPAGETARTDALAWLSALPRRRGDWWPYLLAAPPTLPTDPDRELTRLLRQRLLDPAYQVF